MQHPRGHRSGVPAVGCIDVVAVVVYPYPDNGLLCAVESPFSRWLPMALHGGERRHPMCRDGDLAGGYHVVSDVEVIGIELGLRVRRIFRYDDLGMCAGLCERMGV